MYNVIQVYIYIVLHDIHYISITKLLQVSLYKVAVLELFLSKIYENSSLVSGAMKSPSIKCPPMK